MVDQRTLDRIKLMHPKLRDEVGEIYAEICQALTGKAFCRFTHTLRTFKEQDELFAKGRTAPGARVTNAKGGLSMHNYGLALDIVLIRDGSALWDVKADLDGDGKADWMEIVNIFKQYGWEWGGDWKFYDAPHFQKSFGKSVRELLALHNAKKVDKEGYVLL
ncbi:D-alanyl-D-alanine carboxypeptidase [uncultured Caudovirales phage]|uniref:D-alanyl-D-alanine carboxypeptidase n=1 Tax=uncultured Caudovirales phage TaxID=2100421 RepID=A0A6J5LT95_9CAUD|nr:D-alanyl-D-alanine carboxypeptidase [uncultured Caudovirales phage]